MSYLSKSCEDEHRRDGGATGKESDNGARDGGGGSSMGSGVLVN